MTSRRPDPIRFPDPPSLHVGPIADLEAAARLRQDAAPPPSSAFRRYFRAWLILRVAIIGGNALMFLVRWLLGW